MEGFTQSLILTNYTYLTNMDEEILVKDCVDLVVRGLHLYIHGSEEKLIQTARRDKLDSTNTASVFMQAK